MTEFSSVIVFRVDFNSVDPDTWLVLGALANATPVRRPKVGERVVLVDGERNRCEAWTRQVDAQIAHLEVDEATWGWDEALTPTGVPSRGEAKFGHDPGPPCVASGG